MRIAVDLQCCQTAARQRGMGRYSLSLARAMTEVAGDRHQLLYGLNAKYPNEAREVVEGFDDIAGPARFFFFDYPRIQGADDQQRALREDSASILRSDRIVTLSPDVFHVSSLYEGESVWGTCPAPKALPSAPSLVRSVTLYDLIPMIFPDQYMTHPRYRAWFENTSQVLKTADLLLAISESARQDAIDRLGIPADNVVNILGAASDVFVPMEMSEAARVGTLTKFGVDKPFVFYVGGPDFRKNMTGLMEGFGALPADLRRRYQLVIGYDATGEERRSILLAAVKAGIEDSIVLTGFVSDHDLAALYNLCDLFVFPSLYEGFGLPVLEAMSCGAAVVASDASSIPEILPRKDCLFDPSNSEDIGRVITSVLSDEDFRHNLRRNSIERAKEFSWRRTATLAIEAFERAHTKVTAPTTPRRVNSSKPKLAYFSPLPPAKTGIASYSSELLPYLAEHYEIDAFVDNSSDRKIVEGLNAIQEHSAFPKQAHSYFATLYQLGNSPFHHYMRPYMRDFRGVATIHDAFLGHLSHDPPRHTEFCRLAIEMHGSEARGILNGAADDNNAAHTAIEHLSCSGLYVEQSMGVIAHSHFAKRLLERSASLKVAPAVRVIPQISKAKGLCSDVTRRAERTRLGLEPDGFYVASFGHLASTKAIIEIIEAFYESELGKSEKHYLLLVGELEGGSYGTRVRQAIAAGKAASRISITGFVDDDTYQNYLQSVDVVIQLRNLTRGETSRAMLDALAHGQPLIVNRLGAAEEFSDSVCYKIPTTAPTFIRQAIDDLARSSDCRTALSRAGYAFIQEENNPSRIAEAHANVIHEFVGRTQRSGRTHVIEKLGGQLYERRNDAKLLEAVTESYITQELSERSSRLLIDVTHIRASDLGTGVQRVVREFTRHLYHMELNGLQPQTFAVSGNQLCYADDYAQKIGARHRSESATVRVDSLDIRAFDRVALVDGSWHLADQFREHLDRLRARAGGLYPLVHDIIPLRHPGYFLDFVPGSLRHWLHIMVERASGIACTTRAGADDLIAYINENKLSYSPGLRIGVCPLGADFGLATSVQADEASTAIAAILKRDNVFAMIGTIEPRKNHRTVLDAFEGLWKRGIDATLLLVGKTGWMVEELTQRIEQHPEFGKRLFRLGFISDVDLRKIYGEASAVIMASYAEGFGLPIFEAAHHGTPLILSDIPVFREIAGDYGNYFPASEFGALTDLLSNWPDRRANGGAALRPLTWSKSTKTFRDFIFGQNTYFRFG